MDLRGCDGGVMTEMSSRATTPKSASRVSPETYANFIKQMDLRTIWLKSAKVTNNVGPRQPAQARVIVDDRAEWEPTQAGFVVTHHFNVRILEEVSDAVAAEIEVGYGLQFDSAAPLTDEIFEIFARVNLPVNTWPYVREFLSAMTGRMNWVPFTAPALKRGTGTGGGMAKRVRKTSPDHSEQAVAEGR